MQNGRYNGDMGQEKNKCPGCKRARCEGCGIFQQLNTNKQILLRFPKGFLADGKEGLGISFDVGTTTLAGMLWEMQEKTLLCARTEANPQALYGADVVNRIQATMESRQKAQHLQSLLVKALDEMAAALLEQAGRRGQIKKAVMVGNTAMCELLMQLRPEGIAAAPFLPDYRQTFTGKGKTLGFTFLGETQITVPPPIGGYVGADALAVYNYIRQEHQGENREKQVGQAAIGNWLALDIGTNGEILLQCGEKAYACSTAAGPALEGGALSCGMRAAAGAVDRVSLGGSFLQQDILCHVIAGEKAKGICGSGLVDAIAVLLQAGVLGTDGSLRTAQEARHAGVPERICRRLIQRKTGAAEPEPCFLLAEEVYITRKDIRQMQLAIGAIRAGTEVLLRRAGITAKELGRVYLAGAFGSYIRVESGIAVGLFFSLPWEVYIQAGNLAGMGAAMALLSEDMLLQMEHRSRELIHIELAQEPEFQELFLEHMNFPVESEKTKNQSAKGGL